MTGKQRHLSRVAFNFLDNMGVYICQNLLNCVLNTMYFVLCKLYPGKNVKEKRHNKKN